MALFGVPGHFSAAEWTAWQRVMIEHTHTIRHTYTGYYRRAIEVMVPSGRANDTESNWCDRWPSVSHMRASVSKWLSDYDCLLFTYSHHCTHLHILGQHEHSWAYSLSSACLSFSVDGNKICCCALRMAGIYLWSVKVNLRAKISLGLF